VLTKKQLTNHHFKSSQVASQVTEFPNSSLINKNESDREQEHLDAAPDWAKGSLEKQAD